MAASVTPTKDTVFAAIRAFILSVIDAQVVQGLDNLVSPIYDGIVITPIFEVRLSTNSHGYVDPVTATGTETTTGNKQFSIQIDCYGENAAEWAAIISTLWRDEIACTAMGANVQPIDADEPQAIDFWAPDDMAFIPRYMLTATCQYNPAVVTPMSFFDTVIDPVFVAADLIDIQ